jgi:hypothetical protein
LEVSPLGRVPTGFHSLPVGGVLEAYGRLLEVSWKASRLETSIKSGFSSSFAVRWKPRKAILEVSTKFGGGDPTVTLGTPR